MHFAIARSLSPSPHGIEWRLVFILIGRSKPNGSRIVQIRHACPGESQRPQVSLLPGRAVSTRSSVLQKPTNGIGTSSDIDRVRPLDRTAAGAVGDGVVLAPNCFGVSRAPVTAGLSTEGRMP
jgi:hypothetical protein